VVSIPKGIENTRLNTLCVQWALETFLKVLTEKGIGVVESGCLEDTDKDGFVVLLLDAQTDHALGILAKAGINIPNTKESFGLFWTSLEDRKVLVAAGFDSVGLMYALLELTDRAQYADNAYEELCTLTQVVEKPFNQIRSIKRVFSSEIEDKPWFYDHQFWDEYLTALAASRLNRINLTLGMAIDNAHDPDLRDNYFVFPYPFFVKVEGYDQVKAKYLSDQEREKNLETLRFIAHEAKRRGIHFQLAIWTSCYQMKGCPHENYPIQGINEENHAIYTRDALRTLLRVCPEIDGVTFRLHYESGIPEPAHEFWKVVFEGVKDCGRTIEMDLHAKGADFEMIKMAADTGMPVIVAGKYHAEHFALPYHQAAIRPLEMPEAAKNVKSDWTITAIARRFTRYGYADYLREDRNYGFIYRIFPGTIRLLLWGDPVFAAAYGRNGIFCGSNGIEHMEPLTYKARKDSGFPGRRDTYADPDLQFPDNKEWRKYEYFYRVWGRCLYNPDCDADVWRRYLKKLFGNASLACEHALGYASRILPLITFSHLPSAAHNGFWAEMYTNMPILKESKPANYGDTPEPKIFSTVSPLDSAMFYRIIDFAHAVMEGKRDGKLSPYETADRLDAFADLAEKYLKESEAEISDSRQPEYRRWHVDITAQLWIGRFFANKFRAALEYTLYELTENINLLHEAIAHYRKAKAAWEEVVKETRGVYREDITFGFMPHMRGHWADRIDDINDDIANMEKKLTLSNKGSALSEVSKVILRSKADVLGFSHIPPAEFVKGQSINLRADMPDYTSTVRLHYRHVNQSENYNIVEMKAEGKSYGAAIPGDFTDSVYPVMYFFEAVNSAGAGTFLPGINEAMDNQPYYVIREKGAGK
jgi:hypothetical protein